MSKLRKTIVEAIMAILFTAVNIVAAAEPQSKPPTLPEAAYRTYEENYKDMALAFCIGKAYEFDPRVNADAMVTSDGLGNWGSYDIENNTGQIPKLVNRYLGRQYHSVQGSNIHLDLLKCLDMYHSKELAELVKRYVPQPNNIYAHDNPQ